eukprot:3316733-Pyramimonas_sp.AAC.1
MCPFLLTQLFGAGCPAHRANGSAGCPRQRSPRHTVDPAEESKGPLSEVRWGAALFADVESFECEESEK